MKASAILSAMLLTSSCNAHPAVYSVAELYPHCETLVGKTVKVTGYLGVCAGYDCMLAPNKEAWLAAVRWFKSPSRSEAPLTLSIGSTTSFDRAAASLQGRDVVITGVITGSCSQLGTDRDSGIRPTAIVAHLP